MPGMMGQVERFDSIKRYGFIRGADGQSYFFHLTDIIGQVPPVLWQNVSFLPIATPKGPRAQRVVLGVRHYQPPQQRRVEPDHFIMTRHDSVRGYIVTQVVSRGCWAENNDPNAARDSLQQIAQGLGANAVVNLTLERYSKQDGCSNYHYTMHRFRGDAVVIHRPGFSSGASDSVRYTQSWASDSNHNTSYQSVGHRSLTRPPLHVFLPMQMWSLMKLAGMIALLLPRIVSAAIQSRGSATPISART